MGTSSTPLPADAGATATAVEAAAADATGLVGISELSPRPRPVGLSGISERLFEIQDFERQPFIGLGSLGPRIVLGDGFTETRRLGETHVARDHRPENLVGEILV